MEIKSIQFNDNTWFVPGQNERLEFSEGKWVKVMVIKMGAVSRKSIAGIFNVDSIKYIKLKKEEEQINE